jgi:V/A-type H+-transporting ATPase subunit C
LAEDYTYIVARLRSIEATIPERAWFERLVRTSEESLLGALREHFGGFEGIDGLMDFERALELEKASMLDLVTGLLREERARQFVRAGYDFDNLTHAWKAARLGTRSALTAFGLVQSEAIERSAAGKTRGILPPYLETHIEMLEAVFEGAKSLAACEYAAETAKRRFLFDVAPDAEARSFLRCSTDLANVKTLIRLRRSDVRRDALEAVWLPGGEIEPAKLGSLLTEDEDALFSFLATSSYRRLLSLGLSRETALWRIDPILRQVLLEFLGESRYRVFDFSPVLYHIELRERDYELLRRIIVGRINRLGEETVLERVNALLPS